MIYLSGPVTGITDLNRPAFSEAASTLRAAGHQVMNPHDINKGEQSWEYCLRHDLIAMLQHCDQIAMLPGWGASKGARLELTVAVALGFVVFDYLQGKLVVPSIVIEDVQWSKRF